MTTHYSFAQTPRKLYAWAKVAAHAVREEAKALKKTPVLCYCGMSGTAMATAVEMAMAFRAKEECELGMIYVRKKGEKSHGSPVETSAGKACSFDPETHFFIFVDDFVCHGGTFEYVERKVREYAGDITHLLLSSYVSQETPITCQNKLKGKNARQLKLLDSTFRLTS